MSLTELVSVCLPICVAGVAAERKLCWVCQELHERYYEPRAREAASLQEVLAGPPLKKLLFMTDPGVIDSMLKPFWMVRDMTSGNVANPCGPFIHTHGWKMAIL